MAQQPITDYPIDPTVTSGTQLADILNRTNQCLNSTNSGTTRPPLLAAGGLWVQTGGASLSLFMYDGSTDIQILPMPKMDGYYTTEQGDALAARVAVLEERTQHISNTTQGVHISGELDATGDIVAFKV